LAGESVVLLDGFRSVPTR